MAEYMPDYKPKGEGDKFEDMLKFLRGSDTIDTLKERTMVFLLSSAEEYPRQDIHVAIRKVEREKGWG